MENENMKGKWRTSHDAKFPKMKTIAASRTRLRKIHRLGVNAFKGVKLEASSPSECSNNASWMWAMDERTVR
jgi:hypothetical protein